MLLGLVDATTERFEVDRGAGRARDRLHSLEAVPDAASGLKDHLRLGFHALANEGKLGCGMVPSIGKLETTFERSAGDRIIDLIKFSANSFSFGFDLGRGDGESLFVEGDQAGFLVEKAVELSNDLTVLGVREL